MKLVLKIGGSVLFDAEGNPDASLISEFADLIAGLTDELDNLAVIVGGGKPARQYVTVASKLNLTNADSDQLGILASRMNAMLVAAKLKDIAHQDIPRSYEELTRAYSTGKVVILGGLQPGQSTNAVASLTAEFMAADLLLNVTNVPGVYDADPDKNPGAKLIERLSYNELLEIITNKAEGPASYDLFDAVGVGIVKRSGIKLQFIAGKPIQNIKRAIRGETIGSIVS